MKKVLVVLTGLLLAGSLLVGCREVQTYTDENTTIETRVNHEFTIGVSVDPVGEYFWEQDFYESRLELVESVCVVCGIEQVSNIGIYGSYNTFRYRALKSGDTEVQMTHRRPGTGDVVEHKVFKISVK